MFESITWWVFLAGIASGFLSIGLGYLFLVTVVAKKLMKDGQRPTLKLPPFQIPDQANDGRSAFAPPLNTLQLHAYNRKQYKKLVADLRNSHHHHHNLSSSNILHNSDGLGSSASDEFSVPSTSSLASGSSHSHMSKSANLATGGSSTSHHLTVDATLSSSASAALGSAHSTTSSQSTSTLSTTGSTSGGARRASTNALGHDRKSGNLASSASSNNKSARIAKSSKSGKIGAPTFHLDVVVVRGIHLVGVNRNGLSDPYVKIIVCNQKQKTKYVSNTVNPEWNTQLTFNKVNDLAQDKLALHVYDHEKVGKARLLGSAIVDLRNLELGKESEVTCDLIGFARTDKGQVPSTGAVTLRLRAQRLDDAKRTKEEQKKTEKLKKKEEKQVRKAKEEKEEKERERERSMSMANPMSPNSGSPISVKDGGAMSLKAIPALSLRDGSSGAPSPGSSSSHDPVESPRKRKPTEEAELDGLEDMDMSMASMTDDAKEPKPTESGPMEGLLQLRSFKSVWKERWFVLDLNGYLVYWKNKKKKQPLGMIELKGCELHIRRSMQESAEKEKKATAAKKKNQKFHFDFEIVSTDHKPIYLKEAPDGTPLKSYKTHARSFSCVVRANSHQVMDDWFYAINYAIHRLQIPSNVPMVDVPFLNAAARRYFEDVRTSAILKNEIMRKLGAKLGNMRRPAALRIDNSKGPLVLENIDFGESLEEVVKGVRCATTSTPNELLGEVVVDYRGGIELRVSTFLTKLNVKIPLIALARLKQIAGRLKVYCPPEINSQFWVCFEKLPQLEVDVTLYVRGKKLPVTSLPKLRYWLQHAIENAVRNRLVWPGRIKFFIPFPGRKIELKLITAIPAPPSIPPPAPLPPTEPADAAAKRFLVTKWIDDIMTQRNFELIDEIFTPDCEISGFLPEEGPTYGQNEVYRYATALHRSFRRLRFYVEDIVMEGNLNCICRWKARGTNEDTFWGYPATGEEMIFYGMTINTIKCGNQRIAMQRTFWTTGSILRREFKERERDRKKAIAAGSASLTSTVQTSGPNGDSHGSLTGNTADFLASIVSTPNSVVACTVATATRSSTAVPRSASASEVGSSSPGLTSVSLAPISLAPHAHPKSWTMGAAGKGAADHPPTAASGATRHASLATHTSGARSAAMQAILATSVPSGNSHTHPIPAGDRGSLPPIQAASSSDVLSSRPRRGTAPSSSGVAAGTSGVPPAVGPSHLGSAATRTKAEKERGRRNTGTKEQLAAGMEAAAFAPVAMNRSDGSRKDA